MCRYLCGTCDHHKYQCKLLCQQEIKLEWWLRYVLRTGFSLAVMKTAPYWHSTYLRGGTFCIQFLINFVAVLIQSTSVRIYCNISQLCAQKVHSEPVFALHARHSSKGLSVVSGGGDSILNRSKYAVNSLTTTETIPLQHPGITLLALTRFSLHNTFSCIYMCLYAQYWLLNGYAFFEYR